MADLLRKVDGRIKFAGNNKREMFRDQVLPVRSLTDMIGWPADRAPACGVLMQTAVRSSILAMDGFVSRDDVVIKPPDDIASKGIAGATLSGDGSVVLVLDIEQLAAPFVERREDLLTLAA
jgi:two-component system chemotaxis sensor kinase CheA